MEKDNFYNNNSNNIDNNGNDNRNNRDYTKDDNINVFIDTAMNVLASAFDNTAIAT